MIRFPLANAISQIWGRINTESPKSTGIAPPSVVSHLGGMRLRYLIGADVVASGHENEITEVGYDVTSPALVGISIAYCNLFDEKNTGKYKPYLHTSDTASDYREGQIDPDGPGWHKNLVEQFNRRKQQGFKYVELDNPDAYRIEDITGAVNLAAAYGFGVIGKNPLLIEDDPLPYVRHPAVVGVICEKDRVNTPANMDKLRKRAGKEDLPVWFVAFGDGMRWADACSTAIRDMKLVNMFVTYSSNDEYGSSMDV